MEIGAWIEAIESVAPPSLAEPMDEGRIGLIIEGGPHVTRICAALDVTPAVVRESIRAGADMLVTHHTPLWTPVTRITGPVAGLLQEILSARLNVYVMHTNFDRAEGGVNDILAGLLGLRDTEILGPGRIGDCRLDPDEIGRILQCPIRVWGDISTVRRLAVVGGSGFDASLLAEAAGRGADAYLSAEMKHGVARSSPLPCIEATHYALEAPAIRALAERRGWIYLDDPPRLRTVP